MKAAFRFSIVGLVATGTHLIVGSALMAGGMRPLLANTVAFLTAFFVSFAGHYGYSFNGTAVSIRTSLIRFAVVALVGFGVNQAILFELTSRLGAEPIPSLVVSTGLAALATFLLSRSWAFRMPGAGSIDAAR